MKLESLEELRVFAQIVESGSLTAAARALGMPANTVSRRLAALEERLDSQLLYRTTRSMSLTEKGHTLLGRARRILDEVQATEVALKRETEGLSGVVRISVPSLLTHDMLDALSGLLQSEPGLRLLIRVNDVAVNPVAEGLDVVIMGGGQSNSSLIARKLVDVKPVLAASQAYLERRGTPTSPQDLLAHDTLRFTGAPGSSWVLTDPGGKEHVVPIDCRLEADDGRTLMDAIVLGLGIAFTSVRILRSDPRLVQVLPDHRIGSFPVFAIYPTSRQRSPALLAVVDALQDRLRSSLEA